MIHKFRAFTLTEILVALAIIGTIAALSIPTMYNEINRKVLTSQLQNSVVTVQQLIDKQIVDNNTSHLQNTDFASPDSLFTSSNFEIAEQCSPVASCWPDKVGSYSYKKLSTNAYDTSAPTAKSVRLKNGVVMSYTVDGPWGNISDGTPEGDKCYGLFWLDVNGKDKPNILGRDFFAFRITQKGKIVYGTTCDGMNNTSDANLETWCKNNSYATACLALIQRNNWVMKY